MRKKVFLPECFSDYSVILLNGKIPVKEEQGWQKFSFQKRTIASVIPNGHNIGVVTGPASGLLVVDEDIPELFAKTLAEKNLDLPKTRTVRTSAGRHFYFRYPDDGKEYTNRGKKKEYGFDIRGIGGYVVAPGSIHPDTQRIYELADPRPPADAPEWLKRVALTGHFEEKKPAENQIVGFDQPFHWDGDVSNLPLSHENKERIQTGAAKGSRSEAAFSVLRGLVFANLSDSEIIQIFDSYPIGDKYREKGRNRVRWLESEISRARQCTHQRATQKKYVSAGMAMERKPPANVSEFIWPEPKDLKSDIPKAPEFPIDSVPSVIRDFAEDVSYQLQCPVDYTVIPAIVMMAGMIGRAVEIRPKQKSNWTERACLWGGIIAPKGRMKSQSLKQVKAPFSKIEKKLSEKYAEEYNGWENLKEITEIRISAYKKDLERRFKTNIDADADLRPESCQLPDPPAQKRLFVADITVEKLADLMSGNGHLSLIRDELSGFIKNMNRYHSGSDRQFFLESYSGGEFPIDRVGRGSQYISDMYLNIFGGIQPSVAKECFSETDDDGFFERFQFLVYPERKTDWKNIDEYPDTAAKNRFAAACSEILNGRWRQELPDSIGEYECKPYVRFSNEAQLAFNDWLTEHMNALADISDDDPLIGFYDKMRGSVVQLCLVFHAAKLASGDESAAGAVSFDTLLSALNFFENYLIPNWKRIQAAFGDSKDESGARKISEWLKKTKPETFTEREIKRKGWAGLKNKEQINKALDVLLDCDWIIEKSQQSKKGGRSKTVYHVNPKI